MLMLSFFRIDSLFFPDAQEIFVGLLPAFHNLSTKSEAEEFEEMY